MHAMASQWSSLVRLLVLCLLCGACAAAKRGYHSVSMEKLLRSKAHIDCPPLTNSVTSSGNKLTIPAVCGLPGPPDPPPKCCGEFERQIFNHDMRRLRTLLQRSSVSSSAAATAPPADTFPAFSFFGPAPSADPIPWFGPSPAPSADPPIPWFRPGPAPSADPIPWPFHPGPAPSPRPRPGIPITSPPPPAEAPAVTIPDTTGASFDTMAFVVMVGFGTPAKAYNLIVDTGSDVSWIQCQPCSECYKQRDPVFDPMMSATYAAVPCGHPHCLAAGGNCSSGGTCLYEVKYGDDSSTAGVLSHETLSLTSNWSLHGFVFGCGQNNTGGFGDVDGLIGLGRGSLSLSSQATATLGARFSYCLASYDTVHGYLTIGSATAPDPSDVVQYTKMITKKDNPSLYFVDLVAIDIGGYVVPVPPTVLSKDGTLLDSGTTLMYLPSEAYTLLRDRFKYVMNWTGYEPAPAYEPLDTCYDFSGSNTILLPAVSFNFSDGAVFGLSPVAILVYPDDTTPAKGCFAFLPRPSTMPFNIIGNVQQKGTEIIYDVAAEKIGFGQNYC